MDPRSAHDQEQSYIREEKKLMQDLGNCMNSWNNLPETWHQKADREDFVFHIHALQRIVASRKYFRQHKPLKGVKP